ncbi:MAG: type II secretion system F family protein [Myxococcota bacterium]
MEADNADIVKQRLKGQNLQVEKVKKKPVEIIIRMPGSTGVSTKDLVVFSRQFATMIDAGLPLVQCLDILGSQNENPEFKKVILDVKSTVETGATLAESLRKHEKVFSRLFVNLVAAGEAGGVLGPIMNRLATYLEKNMKMIKQVKAALTYPIMVVIASMLVTTVLLVWVIPIFQEMFEDFGKALPAPTQCVVAMSDFTRANIVYIIIVVGGGGTALMTFLKKSAAARELFDRMLLKAPIFGEVVRKVAVAKFTRTLGTMLSSGVNILEALDIVASTAGNVVVEKGLRRVRQKISEGKNMAGPLSEIPVFPAMVVQMISVGESTGAMDTMLSKIADFYDDEVDAAIGTMMAMIEPLIMMFLAVVLGGLVVAMYLPVFNLAGAVN